MVKVNIHEHWTRVTRFKPLSVSVHTYKGQRLRRPSRKKLPDPFVNKRSGYEIRVTSFETSNFSYAEPNA